MKNTKFALISALLLGTGAFSSCSDKDVEEAVTPDDTPSAVDTKKWTLAEDHDLSVNPGDDFYQYCNGTWIKNNPVEDWDIVRMESYEPEIGTNKYVLEFSDGLKDGDANHEADSVFYHEMLNEINAMKKGEVITMMGKLFRKGVTLRNGSSMMKFTFFPVQNKLIVELGVSGRSENLSAQARLEKFSQTVKNTAKLHTRADGYIDDQYVKFCKAAGLNTDHVVFDQGFLSFIDSFDSMSLSKAKIALQACLDQDTPASFSSAAEPTTGDEDELSQLKDAFDNDNIAFGYAKCQDWVNVTRDDAKKQAVLDMCENLRKTFKERLDSNTWMSATTRKNAIEKLKAIKFFSCYPSEWENSLLPAKLEGETPYIKYYNLRKANIDYLFNGLGKEVNEKGLFVAISTMGMGANVTNAFYSPINNFVVILDAIVNPYFFSIHNSDAQNYGSLGYTIGHEMTHGFDVQGSEYDKNGAFNFWWTYNDKLKYDEECKKLVNLYNKFYQVPGLHADGEKTLVENIADLGGANIAYQAFVNLRKSTGFKGEELVKERRKLFESFAGAWAANIDQDYARVLLKVDEHSLFKNRINGCVMNMGDWYDLYKVTIDNVMYLAPDRRAVIW